jgi:hypothetical protein
MRNRSVSNLVCKRKSPECVPPYRWCCPLKTSGGKVYMVDVTLLKVDHGRIK